MNQIKESIKAGSTSEMFSKLNSIQTLPKEEVFNQSPNCDIKYSLKASYNKTKNIPLYNPYKSRLKQSEQKKDNHFILTELKSRDGHFNNTASFDRNDIEYMRASVNTEIDQSSPNKQYSNNGALEQIENKDNSFLKNNEHEFSWIKKDDQSFLEKGINFGDISKIDGLE